MRITRTVAIFFLVPVTLQIVLLFFMQIYLQDLNSKLGNEIQKKDLQALIDNVQHKHTNCLSAAFLTSMTGYERIRTRFIENTASLKELTAQLKERTRGDPQSSKLVDSFLRKEAKLMKMESILLTVSIATLGPSEEQSDKGRALVRSSMQDLSQLQRRFENVDLAADSNSTTKLICVLAMVTFLSLLSLISAFAWSKNVLSQQLAGIFEKVKEFGSRTKMTPGALAPGEMADVEAAVISASEQIMKLENARQELSSMVAHDLKAPLTSVAGSLELIENGRYGAVTPSALTSLCHIRGISDMLVFVTSILLEFARVKASSTGTQSISNERIEDVIYEELENQGLTDIRTFSCDFDDLKVTLPVEPLARLVAFLIKSFDKPQTTMLKLTEKQGKTCLQLRMTKKPSSAAAHSDTRADSIRTAALMSNIYAARLSHTQDENWDEIEILFPGVSTSSLMDDAVPFDTQSKFRSKFLLILSFACLVNLVTILAIVSAFFVGHRQLESEIESRNVVHWASNVSSGVTELLILAILRDPEVDQSRQRTLRQIERTIDKINKARGSLKYDRDLSRWESNIRKIMSVTSAIARAQQKIPAIIDMVNQRSFDEALLIDTGSFVVSNEMSQSASSQKLIDLFKNLSLQIMTISIIGCIASIGTALLLGRYLVRRLSSVRQNADRLRTRRKLLKPAPGGDDIAYLDRFFYNTANEIDSLERERLKLLSLVRDDLFIPVNQIRSSIEEINLQEPLPERVKEQLAIVSSELIRLSCLIDDLQCVNTLAVEAKETIQLDSTLVSIGELIAGAVRASNYQASKKSVSIAVDNQLPSDTTLLGDYTRMIQVLVNLLSNAIKASPQGGLVRIEVDTDGDDLRISVIDSGPGVPEEKTSQLFQRFSRLDQEAEGTGLGLYISRILVELQGGQIGISKATPSGSRFWISFPRAQKSTSSSATPADL